MNITDVGHLEHDLDTGEDKIEKEARAQRKSAWDISREYEKLFKEDLKKLNILPADFFPRATEHIKEQIELIKKLEKKKYTYRTKDGIYFDTKKFKNYGVLVKSKLKGLRAGSRVSLGEKRNPMDFALWKFSPKVEQRQMEWPSPWGVGFPGWHIECSAMSLKYLGLLIDIHAGGVDHIHPHHTNEIAQSEAAFGKKFARFWMHSEFLNLGKTRMGKSEGNAITLDTLEAKGFEPLDFRYFVFSAHYRSPLSFSWQALKASRLGRLRLQNIYQDAPSNLKNKGAGGNKLFQSFKKEFTNKLNDDLNIPAALAILYAYLKKNKNIKELLLFADHILGLALNKFKSDAIPDEILILTKKREEYRKIKSWKEADALRKQAKKLGFNIKDTPGGPVIEKIH